MNKGRLYRLLAFALLFSAALFAFLPARAEEENPASNVTLFTNTRETCVASAQQSPYRFTPTQDGVYRFYAFSKDVPVELELRLPEEEYPLRRANGSQSVYVEYFLNAGQTALLYVQCPSGQEEEVTLEVMLQKYGQCIETPIELKSQSAVYSRTLLHARDTHYFRFVAPVSGWYTMRTESVGGSVLDTQGYLLNEAGLTMQADDDLLFPTDPNFSITAYLTEGKAYYLRVNAFSNNTGSYRLVLSMPEKSTSRPRSVSLYPMNAVLSVGEKQSLIASLVPENALCDVAYSSADPSVAVVSSSGVVTAVGAGSTQIYAFASGVRAVTTIIVKPESLKSLTAVEPEVTLHVGDTQTLSVRFTPSNATNKRLTWMSSDPEVAQVDEYGTVQALSVGQATVTATSEGGLTAEFTLTVAPPRAVYRALVLGEENYVDGRVREGNRNTTEGIAELLLAQSIDGAGYQVRMQIDSTLEEIARGISLAFYGATENDVSLLYINCHGDADDGGAYLELHDGTHISPQQLRSLLEEVPGQVVIILDCCQSGTFIGAGSGGFDGLSQGRFLVLTSSAAGQDSYRLRFTGGEDEDGVATVLARSLAEGAGWDLIRDKKTQLKADANGDGMVTFAEIYQYTARRVEYYLSGSEVRQNVQASDPANQLVLFAN